MKTPKILSRILCAAAVTFSLFTPVYAENEIKNSDELAEELYSDFAFVKDITTGQILIDKNSTERMYPASMTKIMTVILGIENIPDPDKLETVKWQMLDGLAAANASVMGLKADDMPSARDLFYGAALPSGADACNAIAWRISGGITAFVDLMNKKAEELGMTNTHFMNPTGLHDDNHYTTCRDMAILLEYCLQNETFVEVFSAPSYTTTSLQSNPEGITLISTTWSAVDRYGYEVPGLIGSKTGYTDEGGHCLSYWSEHNGMKLIGVTGHADTDYYDPSHIDDCATVLQYYSNWEKKQLISDGQLASEITVHYLGEDQTIPVYTFETLELDVPMDEKITLDTTFPKEIDATLEDQMLNGFIRVYTSNHLLYTAEAAVKIPRQKGFFNRLRLKIKKALGK